MEESCVSFLLIMGLCNYSFSCAADRETQREQSRLVHPDIMLPVSLRQKKVADSCPDKSHVEEDTGGLWAGHRGLSCLFFWVICWKRLKQVEVNNVSWSDGDI